jgi:mRNA interferase MazF
MPNYSKNEVILIRYPFTDFSHSKVRPAVIVSASHISEDVFIVPLTSKIDSLLPGEFELNHWSGAGLNTATAVKRGIYTIHPNLVVKRVGKLSPSDTKSLDVSLRSWLGL